MHPFICVVLSLFVLSSPALAIKETQDFTWDIDAFCSHLHEGQFEETADNVRDQLYNQRLILTGKENVPIWSNIYFEKAFFQRLSKLTFLEEIRLCNIPLNNLGRQFSYLSNLQKLYLVGNNLSAFPQGICSLEKLTELAIPHNQITEIPNDIVNLYNLTFLNLNRNKLKELPNTVRELFMLQTLTATHNQIHTISPILAELKSLHMLNVRDNCITQIPSSFLQNYWITLNLSINPLVSNTPDGSLWAGFYQLKNALGPRFIYDENTMRKPAYDPFGLNAALFKILNDTVRSNNQYCEN